MIKTGAITILLSLVLAAAALPSEPAVSVTNNLTSMPLAFTENQGQWDEKVLFRADAGGAAMWFTSDGAYYQFTRRMDDGDPVIASDGTPPRPGGAVGSDRYGNEPDKFETMMIKANFVGSNPAPRMVGESMMDYKCNYFIGNDPSQWRADVPNFSAVVYEEIYPGIDLKYYGNGREMEYDFIVSPGADPSQIKIQYEGVETLSVNGDGELVVETMWGGVIERCPVVYQIVSNSRVPVVGEYALKGDNSFGFEVSGCYDRRLLLVIDPVLEYSTYLGGNDNDYGTDIAVDKWGHAIVTGYTHSIDFPLENPYQPDWDSADVFVTKLNSAGDGLIYSTYIGGSEHEYGNAIAFDSLGYAYVTGYTYSSDFPAKGPYNTFEGSADVFVTKLNRLGNDLIYSAILGDSNNDLGTGIAVDGFGCAYVTGYTWSTNFPTKNPYQVDLDGADVFVTKLNRWGDDLVYGTYIGDDDEDYGYDIAIDGSLCAYVTGYTYSTNFPTKNPYQEDQDDDDVFVTKLNSTGDDLVYSTYLGGDRRDCGRGIAVDGMGCAYVTGRTWSADFPTMNPYQTDQGDVDVFVAKLNGSGDDLVYSTYLGGGDMDCGRGIAVDGMGCAYIAGWTSSTNFPCVDPYQTDQLTHDAFVTKMNSTGDDLVYSTYLGGDWEDYGNGIAIDDSGYAYVTGETHSTDFPLENPVQIDWDGVDGFVTKLSKSCCLLRGDVDHGGSVDPLDASYFVNYLWGIGPPPPCPDEADVDGSGGVDPLDAIYLVSYFWKGGPPPVPCP